MMMCSKADIPHRENPLRMRAPEGNSAYRVTHYSCRRGIDVEREMGDTYLI